jgi:multiple sugar transport system permease protein
MTIAAQKLRSAAANLSWFAPAGVLVLGVVFYPIVRTIVLSFTHQNLANHFETQFAGFDNFARLMADSRLHGTFAVTAFFTLVSVGLEFIVGLLLALTADQLIRGRGLMRVIVLVPWTLPTAVIAVLWTWVFNDQFGLLNALLLTSGIIEAPVAWLARPDTAMAAMIAADVWKTAPFVFVILLAGMQNIPRDLYEAIEIDGGGDWVKFRYVTWPHLLPFIFVALIFRMVQAFAVFDLVWVMTGGGPGGATETVSVYIYQTYMRYLDFGYGSAIVVAAVAVIGVAATGLYRLLVTRYEGLF